MTNRYLQRKLNEESSGLRRKQYDLQDKQRANAAQSAECKQRIDHLNTEYASPIRHLLRVLTAPLAFPPG